MDSLALRKRFFDTAIADVLRAVDGGSLMGANALALCVVDYLAYFRPVKPNGGNKENYLPIVDDYLKRVDARYNALGLYALRCALVHTYATSDAMKKAGLQAYSFVHRRPEHHLAGPKNVLVLNADTFVADVIFASSVFFDDKQGDPTVEARGNEIMRVAYGDATIAARSYASMHRALAQFDASAANLQAFRTDVTALYPQ